MIEQHDDNALVYPCADCGKLRSKNQGGTVFTVCDTCWDKHYAKYKSPVRSKSVERRLSEMRKETP